MIRVTDQQFWMDPYLKRELDTISHNLTDDWDFVIGISGDGQTRVGKSVLGFQVAYYVSSQTNRKFNEKNIVFSGKELRELGTKLPKQSAIVYDESRADLNSKAQMRNITKDLFDYFSECGMFNHLIILIMPDFFEFPKSIAINRMAALINVFRVSQQKKLDDGTIINKFKRGHFEFYGFREKKKLYIEGKKAYDDYAVGKRCRNFYGTFPNHYTIDKDKYEHRKKEYIKRNRDESDTNPKLELYRRMKSMPALEHLKGVDFCQILDIHRQSLWRYDKAIKEAERNAPKSAIE